MKETIENNKRCSANPTSAKDGMNEGRKATLGVGLVVGLGLPCVDWGFGIPGPATNPTSRFGHPRSQICFWGSAGAADPKC